MDEEWVGTVEHYYPQLGAVVLRLERGDLHVGDRVHFFGNRCDLVEEVCALQVDHRPAKEAHAGEHAGLRVSFRVPERVDVFIVRPEPAHADFHERYATVWDPSY